MKIKLVTKRNTFYLIILILIISFIILYLRTGVFQKNSIDKRDLKKWNYNEQGLIENTNSFELSGNNKTCWLLIHGYASTPNEMKEIAETINKEFNDKVYAIRLKGHSETPSKIQDLTLEDWYSQVEEEYNKISPTCEKLNVLGFSFGGALTLKLAEEKELNNIYLISPFLAPSYHWYWIIPLDVYLKTLSNKINYIKKSEIAQINSNEGKSNYIAYWNFPLQPVKNSFTFLKNVEDNLNKITENTLIMHSKGDKTANHKKSINVSQEISSKNKKLIIYNKSNHVILYDYDKNLAIDEIINFEKQNRK